MRSDSGRRTRTAGSSPTTPTGSTTGGEPDAMATATWDGTAAPTRGPDPHRRRAGERSGSVLLAVSPLPAVRGRRLYDLEPDLCRIIRLGVVVDGDLLARLDVPQRRELLGLRPHVPVAGVGPVRVVVQRAVAQ